MTKLELKAIVCLDTAFLNNGGRAALRESYQTLSPIQSPFGLSAVSLEQSLKWLIPRGILIKNMTLRLQYLQVQSLRQLLAANVQAFRDDFHICHANDSNILTVFSLVGPSLADAVNYFSISSAHAHMSEIVTSNVRLPFRHLRRFAWYRPAVDGQCLLSVLEDNYLLEELDVCMRHLPGGFMAALTLRGTTLRKLILQAVGLTDTDLQELGRHCKALVDLSLTAVGERLRNVTDTGIAAVAEG
jgi:hypothetical protein